MPQIERTLCLSGRQAPCTPGPNRTGSNPGTLIKLKKNQGMTRICDSYYFWAFNHRDIMTASGLAELREIQLMPAEEEALMRFRAEESVEIDMALSRRRRLLPRKPSWSQR